MIITPSIDVSKLVVDFILNRLFTNHEIETGDSVKIDPTVIAGSDFIDYFNHMLHEAESLTASADYDNNPVFQCLNDFVREAIRKQLAQGNFLKSVAEEDNYEQDENSARVLAADTTGTVDLPEESLQQITRQIVLYIIDALRNKSLHLTSLYETYLLEASKLIEKMPSARKMVDLSVLICCNWTDSTASTYLSNVQIGSAGSLMQALDKFVTNTAKEITAEFVHGAISLASKGKRSGQVAAYPLLSKADVEPITKFLDNYEKDRPDLNPVITVLKYCLITQTKPTDG